MNRINDCFEHIKVIRGVNSGRISNEQIEDMVIRYQLDVNEKEKLLELLHSKKIYPIPEEEFSGVTDKSKEANEKKELTKEERIEILDER